MGETSEVIRVYHTKIVQLQSFHLGEYIFVTINSHPADRNLELTLFHNSLGLLAE